MEIQNINTYDLSKKWFTFVAENIEVKSTHTHLYFFILNKWNSLFWKDQFGLPTENTMECINVRSYKTYINTLLDLDKFGFIKIVQRAKNQNTSNIIEVVKNTKADTKANTKAMLKATTQSDDQSEYQSIDQSIVSIIKHINNKTNKPLSNKNIKQLLKLSNLINTKIVQEETLNNDLETRKKLFKESIYPFVSEYGKELCKDFFLFWTEPNKSKTKLRFELEKTWDIKRRLSRWRDNGFKNYDKKPSTGDMLSKPAKKIRYS